MRASVRIIGASALCVWVLGCTGNADTRREDDVFIAALQADIRFELGDAPRAAAPTFCVAVDPGDAPQSPTRKFVARLKGAAPAGRWVCLGQVLKISPA